MEQVRLSFYGYNVFESNFFLSITAFKSSFPQLSVAITRVSNPFICRRFENFISYIGS